jgi:nucleoside-diphosphate-sugar epimerase
MKNWKDVINLNTKDIFDLCNLLSTKGKFLFASSSELYGSNGNGLESEPPASYTCKPRSIYIDSKRLGESILSSILPKESYRIFRICLAYSPYFKAEDNRVLYEFILKGLKNNEIKLIDEGEAIRQYIYIEDACNMMLEISNKRYEELLLDNATPIFNISNSFEPITIYELAKLIGENLNVPVKKGEPNSNIFFAPKIVKVHPERFLKIFPNYNFINIKDGIKKVCDVSKKNFSNYQNLNA